MDPIIFVFTFIFELVGIKTKRASLKDSVESEINTNLALIAQADNFGYVGGNGIQLKYTAIKEMTKNLSLFSICGTKHKKDLQELEKWITQINQLLSVKMPSVRFARTHARSGLLKAIHRTSTKLLEEL